MLSVFRRKSRSMGILSFLLVQERHEPVLGPLADTNPLLFHSNLQVSARSLERQQGVKWNTYTDIIMRECVRLLWERVQGPVLAISDYTLGAITRMMEVEVRFNHPWW